MRPPISAALAAATFVLGSCAGPRPGGDGLRQAYQEARAALEAGRHSQAIRRYGDLVDRAGPLAPRVRLEFAHSLLRANRFAEAAAQAGMVAGTAQDATRAGALAVLATAEHEAARAAPGDPGTPARLQRALAALDEMLSTHPELDRGGLMASRRAAIRADLARR